MKSIQIRNWIVALGGCLALSVASCTQERVELGRPGTQYEVDIHATATDGTLTLKLDGVPVVENKPTVDMTNHPLIFKEGVQRYVTIEDQEGNILMEYTVNDGSAGEDFNSSLFYDPHTGQLFTSVEEEALNQLRAPDEDKMTVYVNLRTSCTGYEEPIDVEFFYGKESLGKIEGYTPNSGMSEPVMLRPPALNEKGQRSEHLSVKVYQAGTTTPYADDVEYIANGINLGIAANYPTTLCKAGDKEIIYLCEEPSGNKIQLRKNFRVGFFKK